MDKVFVNNLCVGWLNESPFIIIQSMTNLHVYLLTKTLFILSAETLLDKVKE